MSDQLENTTATEAKLPSSLWRPLFPGKTGGIVAFHKGQVILIEKATSQAYEERVQGLPPKAGQECLWGMIEGIRRAKTGRVLVGRISVSALTKRGRVACATTAEQAQKAVAHEECEAAKAKAAKATV